MALLQPPKPTSSNITEIPIVAAAVSMIRCTHIGGTYTTTTTSVNSSWKSSENGYNTIAHDWLKAMRDLSPPRMMRLDMKTEPLDKSDSDAAEIEYRAWMVGFFSFFFFLSLIL